MADLLSITASIIAVLQITSTVTQYLKDVRGGSEDRMRLRDEIRSMICLLEMLKDRIEDPETKDTWVDAVRLLDGPNGSLAQCKKALELLAQKLAPRGRVQQVTQAFKWPFDKTEVNEVLGTIERLKSLFSLAMQNDHIKLSRAVREDVQEISKGLAELKLRQKHQDHRLQDEERRKILDWISPLTFSAKQSDILSRKQEGTCEWFFETSAFQSWLSGVERTIWCPGIPGAGKTVLTAVIVSYLQNAFPELDIGLAFIYCNYKEQDEQTATGLVASLLRNLVESCDNIPEEIKEHYLDHQKLGARPVLADYSRFLQHICVRFSKVFLVIDALDESSEATRDRFLQEIRKLPSNVLLLCTSRHIPDIEQQFYNCARQEIRASNEDVEKYIAESIEQNIRLRKHVTADPSLSDAIINSVVAKVDGMLFLLAQLHIESLARKHDRKAIRAALKQLPTELDDIYHDALERIHRQNSDDVLLADRVLSWIISARRTLTVEEMQHAIAILNLEPEETGIDDEGVPDEDLLLSVCAGMVKIDRENGVIRLVHYTAQQYFERIRDAKFPHAQVLVTQACIRYLSLETIRSADWPGIGQDGALERAHPLLVYAACYWGHHAAGEPEHALKYQILEFLAGLSRISSYILAITFYNGPIFEKEVFLTDCRLWLATNFSLREIINVLLQQGVDVDTQCIWGDTPLMVAARLGNMEIVQMFLDHGADVNLASIGDALYCTTALQWAAWYGHEEIAGLLLKRGADIDQMDESSETALHKASQAGNLAVVRLLLHNGADHWPQSHDTSSPLEVALRDGHEEVFRLLTDAIAKTDSGQKCLTRALFRIASGGNVEAFHKLTNECENYGMPEEVLCVAKMVCSGTPSRLICDHCEAGILDTEVHLHCDICNYGDFDICQRCMYNGKHCLLDSHQLVKKSFANTNFFVIDSKQSP